MGEVDVEEGDTLMHNIEKERKANAEEERDEGKVKKDDGHGEKCEDIKKIKETKGDENMQEYESREEGRDKMVEIFVEEEKRKTKDDTQEEEDEGQRKEHEGQKEEEEGQKKDEGQNKDEGQKKDERQNEEVKEKKEKDKV